MKIIFLGIVFFYSFSLFGETLREMELYQQSCAEGGISSCIALSNLGGSQNESPGPGPSDSKDKQKEKDSGPEYGTKKKFFNKALTFLKDFKIALALGVGFEQEVKFKNISFAKNDVPLAIKNDEGDPQKYEMSTMVSLDIERHTPEGLFLGIGGFMTGKTDNKRIGFNENNYLSTIKPMGVLGKIGFYNTTGGIGYKLFGGFGVGNMNYKHGYSLDTTDYSINLILDTTIGTFYQLGINIGLERFMVEIKHMYMRGDIQSGFDAEITRGNNADSLEIAGKARLKSTILALAYTFP